MDRDDVERWVLLGLSFIGCGIAIWMMLHGHGIWTDAEDPSGTGGSGLGFGGLWYMCIGGFWMVCGFRLVLVSGQGLVTGINVEFLPREQWIEQDLDAVSVLPQEEDSDD